MANNTSSNYLWTAPSLLVPVDVQALVVSNASLNLPWSFNKMKYNNAGKFTDVTPSLFDSNATPKTGVTLHWALPDGITHGIQQDDGNFEYPFAPNRWLVVRYYDGKSSAWLLQSDYLDAANGLNFFLDPARPNTPTLTRIGKTWPATQWPGEGGVTPGNFLFAIGPGNPGFAAYTANIDGVFSFYDSLDDIKDKATPLTYMVMGWYAKAEDDPLLGKTMFGPNGFTTLDQWMELMNELQWTVGDENDLQRAVNNWTTWATANGITIDPNNAKDLYPSRTICQGMVYNVNWLGQNGRLQSGVPQYNPDMPAQQQPMIAFGNTAVDALAALVAYELDLAGQPGQEAAELLEAFSYNQLNTYEQQGGQFELYRQIFSAWFSDHDGENYWYVEDKDKPENPIIDPTILDMLIQLNQQAALLDARQATLALARLNLYGNWWKNGKAATFWGSPPAGITKAQWDQIQKDITAAIPVDKAAVQQLQDDITSLQAAVDKGVSDITSRLPSTQELKKNNGPRYKAPNDPVVLIYGAHRDYRHGEDGRFDEDDMLLTRFTGQTIFGIDVMIPGFTPPLVDASKVSIIPLNLPEGLFPKEAPALNIETFFLDTGNAEAIARAACTILNTTFKPEYTDIVKTQQTAAWNADVNGLDRQMVADASGLQGIIPSKIAVTPWTAPWAPLYMAWEIIWYPSYTSLPEALQYWTFDPATLEYAWDPNVSPGGATGITLSGSTIITPKSTFVMKAQFEKYLDESGKYPGLKTFLDDVSNWDFLSQNMSGFNDKLMALSEAQLNVPADKATADLIKDATQLCPMPEQSMGFFPIRAGHFQLRRCWIVDDFGQVFDPISAVGQTPGSYHPVRGTGLITPNNENLIQLPPRITQFSRFDFNLMNAHGQGSAQEDPTANPVCGWMLPNHLDRGLSLYTPAGILLGELFLTGNPGNMRLRWANAPGLNMPVGTPLEDIFHDYPYLGRFAINILALPNNAAAFIDFLAIIDQTLWTVEPLGGRSNELVSVYIGRPLALVKTQMKYTLLGGLQYSQSWLDSTKEVTGGYENVKFPVQVGCIQSPQDGTMGYFFEDFDTFNTILSPLLPNLASARASNTQPGSAAANLTGSSGYITDNPVSLSMSDPAKNVFVLLDPRGEMNTISGILPIQSRVLQGTLVEEALANMNVTFRTGPLITDPEKLAMPLPSQMSGSWSWIQHTGVTTWEEIDKIGQANSHATYEENYVLKDGWLKLTNALINDNHH
jgi:hypothetical protein